ncbi:MAG: anaerobic ribonucleoside-triphosphate reductase [Candidatus Omnitrophota bacterium]|nr:anaerobic ribonucleoside-triphosphate reductase [Candidatus Omnitrophota bacterium]
MGPESILEKDRAGQQTTEQTLEYASKRDGRIVKFDKSKISQAIFKAAQAVGGEDKELADELASVVALFLQKNFNSRIPQIEEIQDIVEKVLIETGHAQTAKIYILYRDQRTRNRESLRVRKQTKEQADSTDMLLLVAPLSKDEILSWDKVKIAQALVKEASLSERLAYEIAANVEKKIFKTGIEQISTALIRELVDNELFERGLGRKLSRQTIIGMPSFDLDQLILSKSNENSNITANNPEAINLSIAENTIKQYMLSRVFSEDVSSAHLKGIIHIHDLGYPRVYCSSHSLEYLKKYGLKLENSEIASFPAKHARTLTGHLNTFLASMQAYYAGALGISFLNIFYAPYLTDLDYEQIKQEAQYLIFSLSQSAFSRGGQVLFIDANIHLGIPDYLKDVAAIGPEGKYTGKTYGDYEKEAQIFAKVLMDVWRKGDRDGHPFTFPKLDLHIDQKTFEDPEQYKLFQYACQIASENGSPYFVFDKGNEAVLSQCCRLRQKIKDKQMIEHPESLRFCGFQNITINLPQAAFRAGKGNIDKVYKEISQAMDFAFKAHYQKKDFIKKMMSEPGMPMWEVGKTAKDGRPYVDLEKATYIIGVIGLNECVQYLTGKELHEDEDAFKTGLKIISFMNFKTKEEEKQSNLEFALEESPAESASRRLSKIDLRQFPEEAGGVVRGDVEKDLYYYTNSIHLRADAPIDLITRIEKQAKFHPLIESGAIIHAFVGEQRPSAEAVSQLVKKVFKNTPAAQLVISPEFTICNNCHKMSKGLLDKCAHCGDSNVYGITRVVGYYSRVDNWNSSKLGELADRQKGEYKV